MSDLDQAVRAEIDAWTPRAAPPPFDALASRKRARDRRRLATGGAALSAVAIAGAAAFAPSPGEGRDELPTVASSPAPTAAVARPDALARRCLEGVATVPVPGLIGMTEQEAFPPNVRTALRVIARDGACTTDSAAPPADGMTDVVLDGGRVVWAGRRTAPPEGSADAVPVPQQDPADAEVCKDTGSASQCYSVGPDHARQLAVVLATGRPLQPGAGECLATPVAIYRARFMPLVGVIDPFVWEIPSGLCLPMTAGGTTYDLPDDAQADVVRIWDMAAHAG